MSEPSPDYLALVTGATSGIGLATSRRLIGDGATVLGLGRDEEKLFRVRSELGSKFEPVLVDLASTDSRASAILTLAPRAPSVRVYISNAAECAYEGPLSFQTSLLSRLFEVNVLGAMDLLRAVTSKMQAGGQVVQISSVITQHVPNPKFAPYAASKRAIESLTEALGEELRGRGIRLSILSPGLVKTAIYDKVSGFARTREKIEQQVPEWLEADDVADAILWVLSRPPNVWVSELSILPARQAR